MSVTEEQDMQSSEDTLNEIIEHVRNQGQQIMKRNNLIEALNAEVAKRTSDNNELWHNYQLLSTENEILKDNYRRIKEQCDQIARKIAGNPKSCPDSEAIIEKLVAFHNQLIAQVEPPARLTSPQGAAFLSSKAAKRQRKAANKKAQTVAGSEENLDIYRPANARVSESGMTSQSSSVTSNAASAAAAAASATPTPTQPAVLEKTAGITPTEMELTQRAAMQKKETTRLSNIIEQLKSANTDLKQQNRVLRATLKLEAEWEEKTLDPALKEEIEKVLNARAVIHSSAVPLLQPTGGDVVTTTEEDQAGGEGDVTAHGLPGAATMEGLTVTTPGFINAVNTVFQRQAARISALMSTVERLKSIPVVPRRKNSTSNGDTYEQKKSDNDDGTPEASKPVAAATTPSLIRQVKEIINEEDGEVYSSYKRMRVETEKGDKIACDDEVVVLTQE